MSSSQPEKRTGAGALLLCALVAAPLFAAAATVQPLRSHVAPQTRKARHAKVMPTLPAANAVSPAPSTGPESPYARAAAAHGEARRARLAAHASGAAQASP